jgi:hypothetical protein
MSVSEFLRAAARERAERVLGLNGPTLWEQIQPYVLEPTGELTDVACHVDEIVGEEIDKAHARKRRSRQRPVV